MASKSKRLRANKDSATSLVLLSFTVGILALLQNWRAQFSDIAGFYGMHFSHGQNLWPFSKKIYTEDIIINPVEYPALTGLVM
jgi:hypothetical protein